MATSSIGNTKVMVSHKMAHLTSQFFDNTITRGGLGSFTTVEAVRRFGKFNSELFSRIEKLTNRFKKKQHRQPTYDDNLELEMTLDELIQIHVMLGTVLSCPGSIRKEEVDTHCDVREYFIGLIQKTEQKSSSSSSPTPAASTSSTDVVKKDTRVSTPPPPPPPSSSSSSINITQVDDGSDDGGSADD